jgi:shikimate kinase
VSAATAARAGHVVLVGMMGVGKSTVGRRVAHALDRPFVDTDAEVEARTGRSIADLFATDGEPAFRTIEATIVADLLAVTDPSVIAAAGGVVLDPRTRALLRAAGTVVWLQATVDVLVGRVANGSHRPALADDPRGTLERMRGDRQDLYAEVADIAIDSSQPIELVVDAIVTAVNGAVVR